MSSPSSSNRSKRPEQETQIDQTVQGDSNQTIGQLYGGMVVYISGGQPIINSPQTEGSTQEALRPSLQKIGSNPYKGLFAFHEEDSANYFGRSREVKALWTQFRTLHEDQAMVRLLPIYGPSGSGKSSLARAGLIPALGQQPLPGRERARVAVMVPGTKPLQSLATILARIANNEAMPVRKTREFTEELVLVNKEGLHDGLHRIASMLPDIQSFPLIVLVDQFEEVYSLCKDSNARNAFIDNLLYAATDLTQYVSVLLTFRSDFLGETHQHPSFNRLFSQQGFLVPTMDSEALKEAIEQPAKQAGYPIDTGTINLLIEQTEGREGALPLLQVALTRIWDGLAKGEAPANTLQAIGGVGGALAEEAQYIYNNLHSNEQAIARRLFLGLIHLTEDARYTRRRIYIDSLLLTGDRIEQVQTVIDRFASPGVRLITLSSNQGQEIIEITHEALIRHWPLLRAWLDQTHELLSKNHRIEMAASEWQEKGCDKGYLLQGSPLVEAQKYKRKYSAQLPLSRLSLKYLRESLKARSKLRFKLIGLTVIPFLILPIISEYFWRETKVRDSYINLGSYNQEKVSQSLQYLVAGCKKYREYSIGYPLYIHLSPYLKERIWGNCRSLNAVNLRGNNLSELNLEYSEFSRSDLRGANFTKSNLRKTYLIGVDLSGAQLVNTDLSSSNLRGAKLRGANLSDAKFGKANLQGASLNGANLKNTDLRFATSLSWKTIESAKLCNTKLPYSLNSLDSNRDC